MAKGKKSAGKKSAKAAATRMSLPFAPVAPPLPVETEEAFAPHTVPQPSGSLAQVRMLYSAPAKPSTSNVLKSTPTKDNSTTLQTFNIGDLAQFTKEKAYSGNASKDVHLFFVGRDDVHDILKYVLSRVSMSLYLNMFGFDDSELNNILMTKALDPAITMLITLDKSQAGGVHEKALLLADQQFNLAAYNTHFVIGESATRQISHTKGFVADGRVAAEGSTNWSTSGEGTFVVDGQVGGPGYKAQNNTQSIITDPDTIVRFQTELIAEHMTARSQQQGSSTGIEQKPLPKPPATPTTPQTGAKKTRKKA